MNRAQFRRYLVDLFTDSLGIAAPTEFATLTSAVEHMRVAQRTLAQRLRSRATT